MKFLISLLALMGILAFANAGDYKMIKKMQDKIGIHKLWTSCYGGKTMLKFYIAVKEVS